MRTTVCLCLTVVSCLLLVQGCGSSSEPAAKVRVQDYPEFAAWVAHSVRPQSEDLANTVVKATQAYANLDAEALDAVLAQDFQQHDPMLAAGREGVLALARADTRPRGGAPNLMQDTAAVIYDPPWLLIHRGGELGPLRSQNFDLLRFSADGLWQAYFSYLQPLEAGWLDNLLFSFVVPRQLDLIPSAERELLPLWQGRERFSGRYASDPGATNLNREIVRNYLGDLHDGVDPGALGLRYLDPEFQLHLPGMATGREAFTDMLARAQRRPNAVTVELLLAQHDLVWVLSRVGEIREADIPVLAAADLYRLREGLIVEQWKVVQPVPRFANNKNGLFPRPATEEMD